MSMNTLLKLDVAALSSTDVMNGVHVLKRSMRTVFRDLGVLEAEAMEATDIANIIHYQNLLETERTLFHVYRTEAVKRRLLKPERE